MKTKTLLKKLLLLLLLACLYTTTFAQFTVTNKYYKKILKQDSPALFNLTISQKNKFEKDSSTYNTMVYYSQKEKPFGAKKIYIDFIDYKYTYYKYDDSVFLFNNKTKKYYQSNLKTDSALFYFNEDLNLRELGPLLGEEIFMPSIMSSKLTRFETNQLNCIGFTYTSLPVGILMSMGFNMNFKDAFAKPCSYNSVIDTVKYCFKSLYMYMDTSKVFGDNPISMNYKFDKLETTTNTNDSLKKIINAYKQTYQLSQLDRNFYFDYMRKENNQDQKIEKKEEQKPSDESQKYDIPLQTMNNTTIKLSDYKGRYLLLDFWFTNCPPCMREVPKIDSLYQRYKNKNVMIIGINPFDKNIDALKDVIAKKDMKYMICNSDNIFPDYFKVPYYPTIILVSPDQTTYKKIELYSDLEFSTFIKEMDKKLNYK